MSPVILIIEDDPMLAALHRAVVEGPGREVITAKSLAEAQALLGRTTVDLALVDLVLPDGDSRDFLGTLRARSGTTDLPIIVVSGEMGARPKVDSYSLGVDTFLDKPVDPEVLRAAVDSRLRRAERRAREMRVDSLTGRPNRAALEEEFRRLSAHAARTKTPLAAAMLDLDHFKSVNDTHGHVAGDRALKALAEQLCGALRKSDYVARWGGEEFVVLFPHTSATGAAAALRTALAAVRAHHVAVENAPPIALSFSAGVADVVPGASLDEVTLEIDRLLYVAKTTGRARVVSSLDAATAPPRTILLAEDDDLVAAIVEHRLKREGFQIVRVADGVRALEAAEAERPALAILDVMLPGLDGFELLDRFRGNPALAHTPIMMLTSLGSEAQVERALRLGADDYVLKPFSPVEFVARVHRLLARG